MSKLDRDWAAVRMQLAFMQRVKEAEDAIAANPELWNHIMLIMAFVRLREHETECPHCGGREPSFYRIMCMSEEYTQFLCRKDVTDMVRHIWYAHWLDDVQQERVCMQTLNQGR